MRGAERVRLLAVTLVVATIAAAAGEAVAIPLTRGMAMGPMIGFQTLAVAVSLALVLAPIALISQGQVDRLARRARESEDAQQPLTAHAPAWLRGVARSLETARSAWTEEIHSLRTRLREIEIRLKLSEADRQHLETILDSLRDAVIVTDGFDEVSRVNARAAELLRVDPSGDVHRPIDEVIGDERIRGLIRDVRAAGVLNKRKNVEHHLEDEDAGLRADIDVTLECLPDPQNTVGGVVTILRDVTREREISQMKSDFVSQASHELKTPLSSINAYVEMLLDGEANDEASRTEFYQIIRGEAERVGRMIDNMLNISRIEAGIHSFDQAETDFVKVCEDVIETMSPQAAAKSIKINLKSGPLVYTAQADRDLIYQVVMNLVSNAVKYTPEGGRVTLVVENDDTSRSVLVRVVDTGLGIPPDALERVFDKFYRIENYKRVAKGTGLGLNLCKHIVETVHQGTIGVESEMGMGSRFCFTIPYSQDEAA